MNILDLFRGAKKEEAAIDANPYLNAKRAWNEHAGAIIASRRIWQTVALTALLIALGAVGGLIHLASQSTFIPYVVEVDKLGRAAAVQRADRAPAADERIIHAALAAFVHDVRMVSFDRNAQNDAIWRVYALLQSGDPATVKITEYMKDPVTSPARRAEELSVGVEISSVLRQTPETWEITWTERVWNRQGVRVEQYRMRGLATVYLVPPTSATTEEEIRRNPLGIHIKDFTWSRVL
ncbi:MAG: conjugal transfer protein TrbF [Planctomycetota bacterium]|jgi:type IV secretion system protein VirB5|nr:conjugal transfer protein TrbF [Planctomycetota bacterium]